ncbi:hypothetical protein [Streptomyces sp. bgisy034]|uniref:AraC-like ligand-binding domain-containing protein n=1 Tax=Streptomyces sp. bgisy034 TaxID=3413774 RepID=UPI003EBAE440
MTLSCTSYSEPGLLARQTDIELGELRLAEIAGNAHTIERSPQMVRSAPKDSVFASLLLTGETVFLHENGCLAATAGELFVYDTLRPYLFGFSSSMWQILVDVPRELFTQACVEDGLTPDSEIRLRQQIVKLKELRAKDTEELSQLRTEVDHLVRAVDQLTVEAQQLRGALSQPTSLVRVLPAQPHPNRTL